MAVPKAMQPVYDSVAPLIIEFADRKLNEDYKDLCLYALEKLCRKRPSPLLSGKANTWAAGIVYAIGSNNFIFDKTQTIHLTAEELSEPFGLAKSTVANKAAQIKKILGIDPFRQEWILPEIISQNLFTLFPY